MTDRFGNTLLHLHAEIWPPSPEKHAVIRLLLDSGAKADAPNIIGRTPLHVAVWAGDAVAAAMLARRCNMWRAVDHEGSTALDLAREREDSEVVEALENVVRDHAVAAIGLQPRRFRVEQDRSAHARSPWISSRMAR